MKICDGENILGGRWQKSKVLGAATPGSIPETRMFGLELGHLKLTKLK